MPISAALSLRGGFLGLVVMSCLGCPVVITDLDEEPCEDCAVMTVMQVALMDACNDDQDISWRVWAENGDWTWPGGDAIFLTRGLQVVSVEGIECIAGETVCYGAAAGEVSWGVGLLFEKSCTDCCFTCQDAYIDIGPLTCP